MVEIKVYKPIDKEDILWSYFMNEESPFSFSADNIHRIFDENPDETDFKLHINCDGGSVSEGLRIYDVLRTSGKTLHCNIEGGCHSMAIVLLLAAPKENRTANPNARALIHEVRSFIWDNMTAQELREYADEIDMEQNNILDIYAERTGYERSELENLMKEEKVRTAQELIKYGFISKINTYSTNQKKQTKTMANNQKDEVMKEATNFLSKLTNLLKPKNEVDPVNFDFMDADGNVLFSTEQADDTLEVGMVASPDGTFTIEDGRTIVIAGGVITEIQDAMTNDAEVEELQNRISELENALNESQTVITNLQNKVTSTYNAKGRQTQTQKGVQNGAKTIAELKNEALEKRQQLKGGK